ncbi:MAG: sugar transferase [Boseongicola sp.]
MIDPNASVASFVFVDSNSRRSESGLHNLELQQSPFRASHTRFRSLRNWVYRHAIVDRSIAVLLVPFVSIFLLCIWPIVLIHQGRPFIYRAQRMKSSNQEFCLWKIRTMHPDRSAALSVMGGDQLCRVTKLGRILRCARLDETPQIFNVLVGDIRFIGPRPPLRRYVEAYPEIYRRVLCVKPGITGLATVLLHRRERRLLESCTSAEETDELYRRACIPMKARLDILYARRRSLLLDMFVIYRTFVGLLPKNRMTSRKTPKAQTNAGDLTHPDNTSLRFSNVFEIECKAA